MKIYIVRHAIAVPRGTPGIIDDDRPLTEEGIKKMRRVAAGLRGLDYRPGLILSSPLLRARSTAEILFEAYGRKIPLQLVLTLGPSGKRPELYRDIRNYGKDMDSLMLVGHQPSLGEIAGEIVFGSSKHYVELKKGGACVIELDDVRGTPKGRMISLLTPSILRKIASKARVQGRNPRDGS
jgi:phosphohistidine phosphatase